MVAYTRPGPAAHSNTVAKAWPSAPPRRETGAGNAVMGAYLRDLGFGYDAIYFMTHKGPTSVEWLTPELALKYGVAWLMLQPPWGAARIVETLG